MNKEQRKEIIQYIRDNRAYLDHNHQIYDIFNGNLLPYVLQVLQKTLSDNYYKKIESRTIPINVLERYVKKVAAAYETPPKRIANNSSNQAVVDYYVRQFGLNHKMQIADRYSHMFKGYSLEPFMDIEPKLRVNPFDRFLVMSENKKDPTVETILIKFLGKKNINGNMQEAYIVYTDAEIDAFTEDGETYAPALAENGGVNPVETIPLMYGKRAENELLPTQDTDILAMSKLVSVFLSDLSGAVLFQCFSIIYGIDLNMSNAVLSPNALWSFKSDKNSETKPVLGTIKPEADIDKVMNFIVSAFVMWLETKGIRVGSIGSIDAGNMASGISKIIDEMDVYKVVKESIMAFETDERNFWKKMVKIHNHWVETGEVSGVAKFSADFDIQIIFPEPQPKRAKKDIIEEKKLEVDAGFKSRRKAIMELNPDMTEEELELEIAEIDNENSSVVEMEESTEDETVLEPEETDYKVKKKIK
jgi:hypothetical protein